MTTYQHFSTHANHPNTPSTPTCPSGKALKARTNAWRSLPPPPLTALQGQVALDLKHSCPFTKCQGWSHPRLLRDHLQLAHSHELCHLTDAAPDVTDLYICRECETNEVFTSARELNSHVRKRHFVPRTRINLQIVESALFSQLHIHNSFHSEWQDGLDFLSTF
jgi:hypothetical protein